MHLIWAKVKDHQGLLFGALFLAAVNQIFSLLDPQIFRLLIDRYATQVGRIEADVFVSGVAWLLAASVGVAFISRVAKNFQDYFVNVITERVGAALYARGVTHSFALPFAAFEDQRSGELLSKLSKARLDSQKFIQSVINILFTSLVGILFVVAYAFYVHWSIGLAYALIIPILGAATITIGWRIKAAQQRIVTEAAELAGSTTETLRNVELVKSLGLEDQETKRLNEVNDRIVNLELQKIKYIRILSFVQGSLINLLRSAILFLMLWLILRGAITLGEFFSILFYSFFLFNPLQELGTVVSQYQEARAANGVLEEILKSPPEPKPASPQNPGPIREIVFDQVSFQYSTATASSLEGLDLVLRHGETAAFAGPSGSGKTTLVKLLVGLYKPSGGALRINGIDSSEIDYVKFRERIGYVSQETQLFAGTIRENLLFVEPAASDAECLAALRAAEAESILTRGQAGLDTKIGEGGLKLSGGERQRLAIARALLRQPQLLIFDEATSSLDSLTEKAITETIRGIAQKMPDLVTVLVAHRLSTIAHADRIYVLAQGKISETGNHAELLRQGGLYAALWREQSAEGADDRVPSSRAIA